MSLKYNRYEDVNFINKYAALWSYGYLNGLGQTEGLYRTINEIGFSAFPKDAHLKILDVGCGVGRTASDYGRYFSFATISAIDNAPLMIKTAKEIVNQRDVDLTFDLKPFGFQCLNFKSFGLSNVHFDQKSLEEYCTDQRPNTFDIILAVNFLDRSTKIEDDIKRMRSLLKQGGVTIISTPLNFLKADYWQKYHEPAKIIGLFERNGLKCELSFDSLVYREILDFRGSHEDYNTMICQFVKI